MSYVGPESTFISHTVITKVFVIVDIFCFMTQSAGSAFLFQKDPLAHINQLKIGRAVLITGFVFQMGAFCIFTLIAILFHRKSIQLKGDKLSPLRPLFWSFYLMASLIIIRSIYRTIGEYGLLCEDACGTDKIFRIRRIRLYQRRWVSLQQRVAILRI